MNPVSLIMWWVVFLAAAACVGCFVAFLGFVVRAVWEDMHDE